MDWGVFAILAVLIIAVWIFIEIKRFRHKFFAIFLILLILFSYLSFVLVFKGKDIDYKSVSGLMVAGKVYYSWLASVFNNVKFLTTRAVEMNWKANETLQENFDDVK